MVAVVAPSSGGNVLANFSSVFQFLVMEVEGYHQFRIRALGPVAVCRSSGGDRMSNEQAGIPAELAEALSENETAEKIFAALPSSHQNEYLRWIGEAKRAETRQRRAAKAVEMMVDKHG